MFSTVLTLIASAIFVIAFAMYNRELFKGKSSPVVSWLLFTMITSINSSSYLVMTGDWVKTAVAITDCVICYVTLGMLLRRRESWQKLEPLHQIILGMGVLSLAAWWVFRSAWIANMILQGTNIIAFVPLYQSVSRDPRSEPKAPWLIWAGAFLLSLVVVAFRWQGTLSEVVGPMLAFVLHLGIGLKASNK